MPVQKMPGLFTHSNALSVYLNHYLLAIRSSGSDGREELVNRLRPSHISLTSFMRKRQCNKTLLVNSPGKHPVDSIQNWKLFLFLLEDAFVLRALLGYWNKWDLSVPNMFVNETCSTLLPGQI